MTVNLKVYTYVMLLHCPLDLENAYDFFFILCKCLILELVTENQPSKTSTIPENPQILMQDRQTLNNLEGIYGNMWLENHSENNVANDNNASIIATAPKNDQKEGEPKHKCPMGNCENIFEDFEDLRRHIFDLHVPIKCDQCQKLLDCHRDMRKHIFECNIKINPLTMQFK